MYTVSLFNEANINWNNEYRVTFLKRTSVVDSF